MVDVIGILTDQPDSRRAAKYWSVLKIRLKAEGNELTTNCSQLKLKSSDGKRYNTDVAYKNAHIIMKRKFPGENTFYTQAVVHKKLCLGACNQAL